MADQELKALLNAEELAAFNRCVDCFDDGEGYDVPKPMMSRLAQIGVLRHVGKGVYETTEFGMHIRLADISEPVGVPTVQAGDDFDAWQKNPYTIVLQKSIEQDYVPIPAGHPDNAAVDRFANAMKKKMEKSRDKGKFGWNEPSLCSAERLQALLVGHLEKGDPVDVGNFAMMLFNRGEKTKDTLECKPWVDAAIKAINAAPSQPVAEQDDWNAALDRTIKGFEFCFNRSETLDVGYVIDSINAVKRTTKANAGKDAT